MASISASAIVAVNPGVVSAGGTGVALTGLILTANPRVPIGTVASFATSAAVAAYFGPASQEAGMAAVYFAGFDNAPLRPSALLFSQYPTAPVAGYLRGGNVGAALTLTQLQALSGGLAVTVDGVLRTSGTISLAAATSFSSAAAIIAAGFATLGATVAYDSISGAFTFTSNTTGSASAVSFATGTLAAPLMLAAGATAVTSPGAVAATPGAAMAALVAASAPFASFTTTFEPTTADKLAFCAWTNAQNFQYLYVCWTTDIANTTANNTATAAYAAQQAGYSGTAFIYEPTDLNHAAFLMGSIASIDFNRRNGRQSLAFKSQAGLAAGVSNQQVAAQLAANGLNFYGAYAEAGANWTFFYPGSVSGPFKWLDSYVNQIQLNAALQIAALNLLTSVGNIPFTPAGYAMVDAALSGPISAAVDFGTIRAGVTLSATQVAAVNALAGGTNIAPVVSQRGWYLSILDVPAAVRAARGPLTPVLIYTDGQSVNSIVLNSLEVQ